jgi:HEAT repeat protein
LKLKEIGNGVGLLESMSDKRTVRIIVASPGDVQAERDLMPAVIDELNPGIAADRDLRLELYRWETDAYPGFHPEGPQGLIDSILNIEDCDLLVGIFWKRFGTPTKDTQTGTQHEILRAYLGWQHNRKPQIMVYFNQKGASPKSKEETDQWGKVLDFKRNFPKEGLWWDYKGKAGFERLVRNHLTQFITAFPRSPSSSVASALAQSAELTSPSRSLDQLVEAYRDWLTERLKEVYVFGESRPRPLENIFVKPDILEEYQRPSIQADYVESVKLEMERRRGLGRATEPFRELEEGGGAVKCDTLIERYMQTVITGVPGCGKSMLLKYLASKTLKEKERLPIFLDCKTLDLHALDQAHNGLPSLMFDEAISGLHSNPAERRAFERFFFDRLASGNVVIFLDGLDEVAGSDFFPNLHNAIRKFLDSDSHRNTMVISTRPHALQTRIAGLHEMVVAPLTERQIKELIKRYHGNSVIGRRLQASLRNSRELRELARVPFLLMVIARLCSGEERLEEDRLELYRQIVWQLAIQIDREKSVERTDFYVADPGGVLKIDFLKWLACDLLLVGNLTSDIRQENSYLTFTGELLLEKAKRFLEEARRPEVSPYLLSGDVKAMPLLREVGTNRYAFAHLTIHEYLAAEVLWKREDCTKIFCRGCFNPTLAEMEVLPMTLGLTNSPDSLYAAIEQLPESLTFANLRLRARGLAYAPNLTRERLGKLADDLVHFINMPLPEKTPYKDIVVRSFATVTGKASESIVGRVSKLLKSPDSDVRWDAAALLGQVGGTKAREALVEALKSEHDDMRWGATAALERIGGEEAVKALLGALSDSNNLVRERAVEALGRVGAEEAVMPLIKVLVHGDETERQSAMEALAEIGDVKAVGPLIGALGEDSLRFGVPEALEKIGGEQTIAALTKVLANKDNIFRDDAAAVIGMIGGEKAIAALLKALRLKDAKVRLASVTALGKLGDVAALDALVRALGDEDDEVCYAAARALGRIGTPSAVEALIETLTPGRRNRARKGALAALGQVGGERVLDVVIGASLDEDSKVRRSAATALGEIDGERAVAALTQALKDKDDWVAVEAATALRKIGDERAVDNLILALKHNNGFVRRDAVKALGSIQATRAVPSLIKTLKDEDHYVRAYAAEALGRMGAKQAVDALMDAMDDEDSFPRDKAIEALQLIGGEQALSGLIDGMRSAHRDVRWKSTQALSEFSGERLLEALIKALEFEDDMVRYWAAKALGKVGGPRAVKPLIEALEDADRSVRSEAADALGEIGNVEAVGPLVKALHEARLDVQLSAAESLSKIGGEQARAALAKALRNADNVLRLRIPGSLRRIGGPGIVAPLIGALNDESSYVRRRAAAILEQIDRETLFEGLLDALSDGKPFVRRKVAASIGYYGSIGRVSKALARLVNTDRNEEVRKVAAQEQVKFASKMLYFD